MRTQTPNNCKKRSVSFFAISSQHVTVMNIYSSMGAAIMLYGMVWYGMVNVDLYSAIITKVSNALNTLVSGEKPGFQTLSKGHIVLLCSEVVW